DHSSDQHRKHTGPGKSLAVDKAVHAQADHNKNSAQKVNADIIICISKGSIAGAQGVKKGILYRHSHQYQQYPGNQGKGKRSPHASLCPVLVAFSPGDGAQRRTTGAYQIGKGRDCRYNWKSNPYSCKGCRTGSGNPSDINSVYDIIQYINKLSHDQGKSQTENGPCHTSLGKIMFFFSVLMMIFKQMHDP